MKPIYACVYKTTDGYCTLHSDGTEYREPCLEGPCTDEEFEETEGRKKERLTTDTEKIFIREAATLMSVSKDDLRRHYNELFDRLQEVEVIIDSGNLAEVVYGYWDMFGCCNQCGYGDEKQDAQYIQENYKHCPNCGAKMDKENSLPTQVDAEA